MEEFERPLIFVSLEGSSSAIRDLGCTTKDAIGPFRADAISTSQLYGHFLKGR
jgi:hypothetical protein